MQEGSSSSKSLGSILGLTCDTGKKGGDQRFSWTVHCLLRTFLTFLHFRWSSLLCFKELIWRISSDVKVKEREQCCGVLFFSNNKKPLKGEVVLNTVWLEVSASAVISLCENSVLKLSLTFSVVSDESLRTYRMPLNCPVYFLHSECVLGCPGNSHDVIYANFLCEWEKWTIKQTN